MKHLRLFENFDLNENLDVVASAKLGYQTMQSLMLSDKDRGKSYRNGSDDWDLGQVSDLFSDSDYRIFYLNWTVSDEMPETLKDKMGEVEGFVFINMKGAHYYMGIGPEFLGDENGNVIIAEDLYHEFNEFNEKWVEQMDSGKISAEDAKGMYADVEAMFKKRNDYDKHKIPTGDQLPELG